MVVPRVPQPDVPVAAPSGQHRAVRAERDRGAGHHAGQRPRRDPGPVGQIPAADRTGRGDLKGLAAAGEGQGER
jgi:hypothetical protein